MIQTFRQGINLLSIRVKNIISRGTLKKITNGQAGSNTPKAQIKVMKDEVIDGIEFPQGFGFASMPKEGASAIVFFFGGNRDHGSIGTIFDKRYAPHDLEEGEVCIYNIIENTYIRLKKDGKILIKSDSEVKIECPTVKMTGNLLVDGDIQDKVATNNNNVREMREIFNDHVHSGVSAGGANTEDSTTDM